MALRSEIVELLSGFENRMKFVNIVRCLLDYKYPENIRNMFKDKMVLDNIIIAVLVYIKDRTLGNEQSCSLNDIEQFIDDFSVVFPKDCNIDSKILSKYIIVDVLQNGGVLVEYLTYNNSKQAFENMPVRLINEEKGKYHLTDDAFDFLFRMKEIESELDYSITRFRMKEYMKRDNYEKALDQSRELISRIRNMKLSMEDFLLRCKEDISKITVDQYDAVISRTRELLENEYKELTEIQNTAKDRANKLVDAQQNGVGSEDTKKQREALSEIINNISLTISEQRSLINKKTSLSESYQNLLKDNFVVSSFERLDFEKNIMTLLRKSDAAIEDAAKFLLFPLIKPEFDKKFSLENFYVYQTNLNETDKEYGIDIEEEETDANLQIERRNELFKNICIDFFKFLSDKTSFPISDFISSMRLSQLSEYCEQNALPNVMMSLFALQKLNIEEWKNSERFTLNPNGEFELTYYLDDIPEEYLQVKQIYFKSLNKEFSFSEKRDGKERNIDMTDFCVEVIR